MLLIASAFLLIADQLRSRGCCNTMRVCAGDTCLMAQCDTFSTTVNALRFLTSNTTSAYKGYSR